MKYIRHNFFYDLSLVPLDQCGAGHVLVVDTVLVLIAADAHADVDAGERDAGRGCGDGTARRTNGYIAHARIARG